MPIAASAATSGRGSPFHSLGVMSDSLHLGYLLDHIAEEIQDTVYPPGRRVQLALACFCIVQDHHHAIAVSIDRSLYASAMVLTRPLYEATVKGMWISYCATDESVERYASTRELPGIGQLIEELGNTQLSPFVQQQLVNIKENHWKPLSSFVHCGTNQVKRWVTPNGVSPQYSEAEVNEISNFTGFFAVIASIERARLGNNLAAIERLKILLPEVGNNEA
jgi:hypothetical protein